MGSSLLSLSGNTNQDAELEKSRNHVDEALHVTEKASERFERVVLFVWRAYCIPESRQSKYSTTETVDETYRREIFMRKQVENAFFTGGDVKKGMVKRKKMREYHGGDSIQNMNSNWEDQIGGSENKIDEMHSVKST